MRNSQSITDLRDGGSIAGSPTSLAPSSLAGGDQSTGNRIGWGLNKDRGKKCSLLDLSSHRLFRSLDVSTITSPLPIQVDRLTDSPSPPPPQLPFRQWSWMSGPTCYSPPTSHTSLIFWPKTTSSNWAEEDDDEASFSCDSLDLSRNLGADEFGVSPLRPKQTPRKRWQNPAPPSRPAHQDENMEAEVPSVLFPRFVYWELPSGTSHRRRRTSSKSLIRVPPRMRSEVCPPPTHKCDLKAGAHRTSKTRSRPSNRDRKCSGSGHESMPEDLWNRSSVKSSKIHLRRHSTRELVSSKNRFSSSSSLTIEETQFRRGTCSTQLGAWNRNIANNKIWNLKKMEHF